ncbi:MAG: ATP-binding cassette domain-containing protein [Planctomycetota bacterium]|nr:ATP-binding cassette domain-containing protein [Planctomycetota bacterium]
MSASPQTPADRRPPVLSARDVSRAVGGRALFEGIALTLAEGDVLVVRGPSGAGKTLLLRQLGLLDPLTSGELACDGRSATDWGGPAWRARIATLPQGAPVLPGTPGELAARVAELENQREREREREREAPSPRALAAEWGLADAAWEELWSELSVGERQRAQLAVVLARRPRALLLDEPTSALDPTATAAVEHSLRGQTAVWVTHDRAQAERVSTTTLELGA